MAGGVGAYWFGFARYTTTPGVIGLAQAQRSSQLDGGRARGHRGHAGVLRDRAARARCSRPTRSPARASSTTARVTLTLSLGKERYDVPQLAGMTEDQAQDALAETSLGFGKSVERCNETVPEGKVIRSDPEAGTTLRPGAAVDLIVSKGRAADQGQGLGRQGRRRGRSRR